MSTDALTGVLGLRGMQISYVMITGMQIFYAVSPCSPSAHKRRQNISAVMSIAFSSGESLC